MILKNFLKPKWQHRKPDVRRLAIQKLNAKSDEGKAILAQIVTQDDNVHIRQMVVKKVYNLDLLVSVSQNDADERVRATASVRYLQLLCGQHKGPTWVERIEKIKTIVDIKILEELVRNGVEAELRLLMLDRVQRESLFGDLAITDEDHEVRMAALNKITQKSTLERVFKQTRAKDKRVSACAKDKLNVILSELEKPQLLKSKAKQICVEMEALKNNQDWSGKQLRCDNLISDWKKILDEWHAGDFGIWDAALNQRFNAACDSVQKHIQLHDEEIQVSRELEQQLNPIRSLKRNVCEKLELMLTDASAQDNPNLELRDQIDSALKDAQNVWTQPEELPKDEQQNFSLRFNKVCANLKHIRNEIRLKEAADEQLTSIKRNLELRLRKKKPIESHEIDRFGQKLTQIKRPSVYPVSDVLELQIGKLVESLKNRFDVELAKQKENLELVKTQINELERILASGKSQEAVEIQKQIQKILQNMPGRDIKWLHENKYHDRYNQASKQVQELRKWKQWASTPLKQKLVEEMERLAQEVSQISSELDFNSLSKEIQLARNEWKKLGESEPGSAQELWDRFNLACNKAYEPCNAYFEAQARFREDNLKKKQVICQELDNFIATANWEEMDWKQVERILRVAQSEWMAIGPVDRKDKTGIIKRFHTIMDDLRGKLKTHRDNNEIIKNKLVEQARELVTVVESDAVTEAQIKTSIEQAKALQAKWKNIGISSNEKQLWKKFRANCNKIFDRRKEQIEAKDHERKDNMQTKVAICDRLDHFSELRGDGIGYYENQLQLIHRDWTVIGPVPKDAVKDINIRYKNAYKLAERHIQNLRVQEQKEKLTLMLTKIDLCANVEFLTESNDNSMHTLEELQKQWQLLQTRDDYLEQPLQDRFQNAVQQVIKQDTNSDEQIKQLAELRLKNEKQMEHLCVRLEVLAEVESPSEASQARMEYQVSRLAQKMKNGDVLETSEKRSAQENEALLLLREWSAVGPISNQRFQELNSRFVNTLNSLFNKT